MLHSCWPCVSIWRLHHRSCCMQLHVHGCRQCRRIRRVLVMGRKWDCAWHRYLGHFCRWFMPLRHHRATMLRTPLLYWLASSHSRHERNIVLWCRCTTAIACHLVIAMVALRLCGSLLAITICLTMPALGASILLHWRMLCPFAGVLCSRSKMLKGARLHPAISHASIFWTL